MDKKLFFGILIAALISGLLLGVVTGQPTKSISDPGSGIVSTTSTVLISDSSSTKNIETYLSFIVEQLKILNDRLSNIELAIKQQETPKKMFNAYLYLPGIPGEATDPAHNGWIELVSFTPSEFSKLFDISSQQLQDITGTKKKIIIPQAIVEAVYSDGRIARYTFNNVWFHFLSIKGDTYGDFPRLFESYGFNATSYQLSYS